MPIFRLPAWLFGRPARKEPEGAGREAHEWHRALQQFERNLARVGLPDFWQLMEWDYAADLKELVESTENSRLFTLEERDKRIQARLLMANENFKQRAGSLLDAGRIRFGRRKALSIEQLRQGFVARSRVAEWNKEYQLYLKKVAEICQSGYDDLFSTGDRYPRMQPLIRSLRRTFKRQTDKRVKLFSRFYKLWRNLPPDELDEQLETLKEDYKFLGRRRIWFRSFETFVNDVVTLEADLQQGTNEPTVRVLQSDFITSMNERLTLYWRYHQLREQYGTLLADQFSHLESGLLDLEKSGADGRAIDDYLRESIHAVEEALARREDASPTRRTTVTRLVKVDHRRRLTEWADFRQYRETLPVNQQFNKLKPILLKNSEWAKEMRVFQSIIKEKRNLDPGRHNSPAEKQEVYRFVHHMGDRVEAELSIDVAYRLLEQELIRNREFLDELAVFRRRLADEIRLERRFDERRIDQLKREFIENIWRKRAEIDQSGLVLPLLPKAH